MFGLSFSEFMAIGLLFFLEISLADFVALKVVKFFKER